MQEVILQNNFIGAWFLEDVSICDYLINLYESNPNRQVIGNINNSIKDATEIYFDHNEQHLNEYVFELQKVCEKYIEKYNFCNDIVQKWTILDSIKIQKYTPPHQGYHAWHCERDTIQGFKMSRHLVFLTYLNDITDDGETEFYYQKIKVRPQKGLTLIWPADWTHTHRGIISPTQTKYIITGWYNFW